MQALESADGPNAEETRIEAQEIRSGTNGFLNIDVQLPAGYHLNPLAPQRYKVSVEGGGITIDEKNASRTSKDLKLPLRIPVTTAATRSSAHLRVQVTLFYCREDNTGTCRIKTLVWQVPVTVVPAASAPAEVKLQGKLTTD
jgi:hypothetical protein